MKNCSTHHSLKLISAVTRRFVIIKYSLMGLALFFVAPHLIQAAPVVRSASGASTADVQAAVDGFRTDVSLGGALNAPNTGPFVNGRREINWDGVPDAAADPNALPGTFFNNNSKRGAVLTTPGTSLSVSANAATATPVRFGSINAAYSANFQTFSPQRLFAALGSTIVDVTFFVPTSPGTPATVNGFGAVFTDVEIAGITTIEYFNANGDSLGTFEAPVGPDAGLSFLGVSFNAGERVARVRITSGNAALGASTLDSSTVDVVVMDDFIYGEPLADSDNDGVPDAFDDCPDTGAGDVVDANGCSIAQLVPCIGPASGGTWENHGQYVSATVHVSTDFLNEGLITHADQKAIVTAAARSDCGRR